LNLWQRFAIQLNHHPVWLSSTSVGGLHEGACLNGIDGSMTVQNAMRNRLKKNSEAVARYSTEHEKSIPNRPLRRRMVLHRASPARPEDLRRTPQGTSPARDSRRRLLRAQERRHLAPLASRLPTLENRLPPLLLPPLAPRDGTWERLHEEALGRRSRVRLGRDPQPSGAGIVDSQSVKTTGV
jgi:hypothetical protein